MLTIYAVLNADGWEPFFQRHDPAAYRDALNPEGEQRYWLAEGWAHETEGAARGATRDDETIEEIDTERMAQLLLTQVLGLPQGEANLRAHWAVHGRETRVVSVRFPVELITRIDAVASGNRSGWLERAARERLD